MPARVTASGKNLKFSVIGQLMTVVFNFILRRIFIKLLGTEYTGFAGLCGHMLNFLSLLEPGFDGACAFCLYNPIARGDTLLVRAIMAYIKRVYRIIGILTFSVGACMFPLLFLFSPGSIDLSYGAAIYFLMLFEMSASYFFTHRSILPFADQKNYTVAFFGYITFAVSRLVQLAFIGTTGSYIGYIVSGIVCGFCGELLLYRRIGRMYPFIKEKNTVIPENVKKEARSNAFSLLFRKAGAVLCGSADNMAVFTFLGLGAGTRYSNYTMLSGICLMLTGAVAGCASASVGNLGAVNGKSRMYSIYRTAMAAIVPLSGFFACALFLVYPLAIGLWLSADMAPDTLTAALSCIYMFVCAIRKPCTVFIDSMGLFGREKIKSLTEAIATTALLFFMTPYFGIKGVIFSQLCVSVLFSLPFELYILFRHGFEKNVREFLRELLMYIFALVLSFILSSALCVFTDSINCVLPRMLARITLCAVSCVSVFFVMFFDSRNLGNAVYYGKRMLTGK